MSDQWYENRKYLVSEVARLEARVRELEDADLCLSQLQADNLEIRDERDALRDRVRELERIVAELRSVLDTAADSSATRVVVVRGNFQLSGN